MKHLILILLFFLFSQLVDAQKLFYRDSIYAYSQVEKITHKLMMKDINVHVNYTDPKQHEVFSEALGYMYYKDNDFYICIKKGLSKSEIETLIIHEMIHVFQVYTGKLKTYKSGWVWNEKFYPINTPYKKRIHEIDAKILESNRLFY